MGVAQASFGSDRKPEGMTEALVETVSLTKSVRVPQWANGKEEVRSLLQQNERKGKLFLRYLEEVQQVTKSVLEEYRYALQQVLNWAGDDPLEDAPSFQPALPLYLTKLSSQDGQTRLSLETQKCILNASRHFFYWAKATYPREFSQVGLSWIETLKLVQLTCKCSGTTDPDDREDSPLGKELRVKGLHPDSEPHIQSQTLVSTTPPDAVNTQPHFYNMTRNNNDA